MSTLHRFRNSSAASGPPAPSQPRPSSGDHRPVSPSPSLPSNSERQSQRSESPGLPSQDGGEGLDNESEPGGRRRRRDSSNSDSDETSLRTLKRLKLHADQVSKEHNLPPGGLDRYAEVRF